MAVVGTKYANLQDVASRTKDGKIQRIAEILNETNEILDDALYIEANNTTGHQTTVRSGLPTPTWRQLYQGVQPTKSKTVKVTDTIGMLEAYSEVDVELANLNNNSQEFRMSEDKAFLEGMSQEMANTLIYGNTETDPEKFMGLAPRYNDLSAENAANIISGGGSGSDNTSIWLVTWDDSTCHMIYPKGSQAGLSSDDKGQTTKENSDGSLYEVYRTHYKAKMGLVLRDWRYVVRIANIDVSDITKDAATGADIIDLMVQAQHKLRSRKGRQVWYANETIITALDRQIMNRSTAALSLREIEGREVMMFRGRPVRRVDAILDTEATVS